MTNLDYNNDEYASNESSASAYNKRMFLVDALVATSHHMMDIGKQ